MDGEDYLFVSRRQFEAWLAEGALLEHAVVYGEYKGIPRRQVAEALARGTDVVLRVDVQGAATLRALMPDAVSIFLVRPIAQHMNPSSIAKRCLHWPPGRAKECITSGCADRMLEMLG